MRAIEANGKIDDRGILRLDAPLQETEKKVKVIILVPEEKEVEEKEWLSALNHNPAFDFLNDEEEDIYSLTDGKPLHDEGKDNLSSFSI